MPLRYDGAYSGGFRSGMGRMDYSDGNSYNGNWRRNAKEGYGTFSYANGDVYAGQFHHNKKHGRGAYKFANSGGLQIEGTWRAGAVVSGKIIYPDGSTYHSSQWAGGLPKGAGIFYHVNGVQQQGSYEPAAGEDGGEEDGGGALKWVGGEIHTALGSHTDKTQPAPFPHLDTPEGAEWVAKHLRITALRTDQEAEFVTLSNGGPEPLQLQYVTVGGGNSSYTFGACECPAGGTVRLISGESFTNIPLEEVEGVVDVKWSGDTQWNAAEGGSATLSYSDASGGSVTTQTYAYLSEEAAMAAEEAKDAEGGGEAKDEEGKDEGEAKDE